jgi:SAM-dependent methyltransferase
MAAAHEFSLGDRFAFGENWQSFIDHVVDERRIAIAMKSLQRMLKATDLRGKTFLDIGCGSGLFSLAAVLLGAQRVAAFDYDPNSVRASLTLRQRASISAEQWHVSQGSILDPEFLATCEPVDVVYSWGVLHHTGSMWLAMDNAVAKVKPEGVLAIAIYNRVEKRIGGSATWWWLKRGYNRSPVWVRGLMERCYGSILMLRRAATLRSPVRMIREYGETVGRGMDFWHDVRDWLGGFPYEYATAGEVFNYLHEKHGLKLIYLNSHDGLGLNEFTFRRSAD